MRSVNSFVSNRVSNRYWKRAVKDFFNSIFSIKGRITALLLITTLLAPLFFLQASRTAIAQGMRSSPIVQSDINTAAPPQPFIIGTGGPSLSSHFSDLLFVALMSVSDYFSSPQLPIEFSNAHVPSSVEKLFATVSPIVGFFVPTGSAVSPEPLYQPSANVDFDFDGDGKTDFSRWQPSSQEWRLKNSSGGSVSNITIGSSSSVIAPGDFDGDGKTDRAVFSSGTWTVKQSSTGSTVSYSWGTSGDKPVPADYDGNGTDDLAIFRPSTNTWWIYFLSSSTYTAVSLGSSGDLPVQADYDGDGKADVAVYRPSNGNWYVTKSSGGSSTFTWGNSGDTPVPADYDYDGKTDYAIYRPSTGAWWIYKSGTGTYIAPTWGNYGDQPVPGDYDGDHKADLAIWRPTNGVWYIVKSSTGGYQYETMGQIGDIAAPSAYTKQIGALPITNDLAKARLSPRNATGGTNLYSQNFSWGTGLVNLPGRAGLDMGLGISYNSLVWTKQGSNIFFDSDYSNVSPGFRLEFPTIEPVYQESGGDFYYVVVNPSGARTEFKQTAVTNSYETADSSYLQLKVTGGSHPTDPVENLTITVYGTDGTQMSYEWKGGACRCKEIKDRNGNYISIYHNDNGLLYTVTDTLGRVITVNYDNDLYPISVTQTWKDDNGHGSDVTHTYATFAYTAKTVSTSFSGSPTVYGPPNDTVLKVLDTITYADAHSYTKFDYNGYIQVGKIRNYAYDGHLLNSVTTNLNSVSGSFADCPRLEYIKNWAQNFNGDTNDVEADAESITVYNEYQENNTDTMPNSLSGTKTRVSVYTKDHPGGSIIPDGVISNIYYRASSWSEGLPIATQDCIGSCSGSNIKRWTATDWTQDDENLSYMLNPRVTETKVGDGTNTKRTTYGYYTPNPSASPVVYPYGLVNEVKQYASNQSTVLKKTTIDYVLSSTYTDKRIIGLPSEVKLYDGSNNLASKVTYGYDDEDGFTFDSSSYGQNVSPTQHDNTNYSTSLESGRGNLTSITRWDGNYPTTSGSAVMIEVRHDTAGSVVAQIDAGGRRTKIDYTDSFNSTVTNATYAYPTKLTEMANSAHSTNNYSQIQYRFDIGTNVWAKSPHPDGNGNGKISKRLFDSLGRLERQSVYVDTTEKSYVRYEYPNSAIQSLAYSTVIDVDNDGNIAEDEVMGESWTDGAGRVRMSRVPHKNGNYAATKTEYDVLGRVTRQSVPTEVDSSWAPAGDDLTRGFVWNSQEYDWKGRTTRTVPSDSDGTDDKDTLISYEGCGCAGGQTVTVEGPSVPVPGESYSRRRKQKSYADILGRTIQQESYDWDGDVYATSVNTYNTRDQITNTVQYAGTTSSGTHQETTWSYDGHGRLSTSHRPEQFNSTPSATYTTNTYNTDDSLASVTDGRGAVTNYSYNARGLLSGIGYSVPGGSGITDPSDISFSYDDLGNRLTMYDGAGHVDYEYNPLSQLTAETRQFSDTLTDAPLSSNRFKLEYTYGTTGQLKSYKDPYGQEVDYTQDNLGRLSSITGSSFAGVTTYANNPEYRAWGALKHLEYGDSEKMDATYNDRLQTATYHVTDPGDSLREIFNNEYEYFPDGKLKTVDESLTNVGSGPHANDFANMFDRTYEYDHQGRVSHAEAGYQTSGGSPTSQYVPYIQDLSYNALGNLTGRESTHWNFTSDYSFGYTMANNRITDSGYTYDNNGNMTAGDSINYYYDG
jgi:YD repeat-containing protein